MRSNVFSVLALTACCACEGDRLDGPALPGDLATTTPSDAARSAASTSASAAAPAVVRGLAQLGNDAQAVAELRAVLAQCKAKLEPTNFLDGPCEPFEKLKAREASPQAIATWVEVLFDPDPAMRRVASLLLNEPARSAFARDAALKIVEALEQDLGPSPSNTAIAWVAIRLDPKVVGQRLTAIGTSPKTPLDVRSVLAMWWSDDGAYAVTASLAKEPSKEFRQAAMAGYARNFRQHQAEACSYWAATTSDPDEALRSQALGFLSGSFHGYKATDSESDWYYTGSSSGPTDSGYSADWCPAQIDVSLPRFGGHPARDTLPVSTIDATTQFTPRFIQEGRRTSPDGTRLQDC